MNRALLLFLLCQMFAFQALAQSRVNVSVSTGISYVSWRKDFSSTGYANADPLRDGYYTGNGTRITFNASGQYMIGKFGIGPSLSYHQYKVDNLKYNLNSSHQIGIEANKFINLGLKVGYSINLTESLKLAPVVEYGIFNFYRFKYFNKFFSGKQYYLLGIETMKSLGKLSLVLGINYDRIFFDYPEIRMLPTLVMKRNTRINNYSIRVGIMYPLCTNAISKTRKRLRV